MISPMRILVRLVLNWKVFRNKLQYTQIKFTVIFPFGICIYIYIENFWNMYIYILRNFFFFGNMYRYIEKFTVIFPFGICIYILNYIYIELINRDWRNTENTQSHIQTHTHIHIHTHTHTHTCIYVYYTHTPLNSSKAARYPYWSPSSLIYTHTHTHTHAHAHAHTHAHAHADAHAHTCT